MTLAWCQAQKYEFINQSISCLFLVFLTFGSALSAGMVEVFFLIEDQAGVSEGRMKRSGHVDGKRRRFLRGGSGTDRGRGHRQGTNPWFSRARMASWSSLARMSAEAKPSRPTDWKRAFKGAEPSGTPEPTSQSWNLHRMKTKSKSIATRLKAQDGEPDWSGKDSHSDLGQARQSGGCDSTPSSIVGIHRNQSNEESARCTSHRFKRAWKGSSWVSRAQDFLQFSCLFVDETRYTYDWNLISSPFVYSWRNNSLLPLLRCFVFYWTLQICIVYYY